MAVVNIDNGIAAGVVAAAIARRVARGSSAKGR
jgi:NCAIR mutase (PurE)-related protein